MIDKWKVIDEETEDHFLVVEDPNGWYEAYVKWDGCITYNKLHNVPLPQTGEHPQLIESIHICDIDEEIERLQELKKVSIKHFGDIFNDR